MHLLIWLLISAALAACAPATPPPAQPAPEMLLRPGVSLELARHRAATISGVEYDLALDVTGKERAPGTVTLRFQRAANAGDLVLDFRGLALDSVSANGVPLSDYSWENGHIRISERYLRTGANTLGFRFAAAIAPVNASIIRYDDPVDSTHYVYTLLVPADANLLFPSFDQPDLKGVFRTEIVAPKGWQVLANGPVADRVPEDRAVRWRFAPTEPISTYLAAFAAGPWKVHGDSAMRLYSRASVAPRVDADTLIRINQDAARWLEQYFAMGFPFAKMDALLAPAFPFGGMEHVGAIFYNENTFVFREPPTLNERLGRKATIYHEVAHQWFGDLVTMRWFDDLWLKEGFSTYMAAKMQDALDPESDAWKSFYLRNKPLAYGVDMTTGTVPVWQELPNLDLAKSNYGPIVYNKAPAILKQLNFLVGEDAFRAGMQRFLRRYAYRNATWEELLREIEGDRPGSLAAFGEQYILRAGMPVIQPVLTERSGQIAELSLVQSPARTLVGDRGGWWPGRVQVRLGYRDRPDTTLTVTFTGNTTRVESAAGLPLPDYIFPNEGDYGYGLFLLDPRSTRYMLAHVGEVQNDLLRAMVWGSLWDLVREARLAPAEYVELALRELPRERDEQIAAQILARGSAALARYVSDADAARLGPRWESLLLARVEDSKLSYGLRKSSLDALIGAARTPQALGVLREYLAGTRRFNGEPVKQPTRWAIVGSLLALGDPAAPALYSTEQASDTTADAKRQAFIAGAAVPAPSNKAAYFARYLDDPDLNEEWVTASLSAFHRPEHAALTLPHLRPALDRLEWIRDNRRIFFLPRWLAAFISGQESAEALAIVDRFLAERPDLPIDLRRKVLQARDDLERTVRIRAAFASPTTLLRSPGYVAAADPGTE